MELPRWASRAAALLLLAGVLSGFYGLLVAPFLDARGEVEESLAQADELSARYERIGARRDALEAQLEALTAKQAENGVYLEGTTDTLAAAQLQERVGARIAASGGTLRSIQILPAKSDGDFRRVSLRVQFTGTIQALADLLYALETERTHLFVDNLDVRNRRARRRARTQEADPNLTIRFDLLGYLRPEAG